MWLRNPFCERCKVHMILPEHCKDKIMRPDGGFDLPHPPDNLATIQHRYHKRHPLRNLSGGQNFGERRRYLWCYRCNQEYNDLYENPSTAWKNKTNED